MPAAASSWLASAHVIVLSTDRALIDLLRDSLAGMHRVWRADDVAHAEELIVAANNPVFLVDASLADSDTRALVNRVHQRFPDLAIIVAGRRDDEALLAPIVSSGVIFRCLPDPASAEQIRNSVDATQNRSRRKTDVPAAAPRKALSAVITGAQLAIRRLKFTLPKISVDRARVRRWSGRCLLLVSLLLTVWVLSQWKPWNYAAGLFASLEPAPAVPAEISNDAKLHQLLDSAGIALTKDRLVDPPGKNALELYRAALALDPDNELAQRGIDSVADKLLAEAEQALQARDMARLASAVDAARAARPDDPRLEYYSLQLERARTRSRN
jgi:DNA-binding NarL/FixJ family response regulator